MTEFTKLDRVIKRQRHQALNMLITFVLVVGGTVASVSSLTACAQDENDAAAYAVSATLDALSRSDSAAAEENLAPGTSASEDLAAFRAEMRKVAPEARYT